MSDASTLADGGVEGRRSSATPRETRAASNRGRGTHRPSERARREQEVSLLDMIDRLLAGGVVVHGDITLAVADVDLIYLGLRAIIAPVDKVGRDLIGPLNRPSPLDRPGPLDRRSPVERPSPVEREGPAERPGPLDRKGAFEGPTLLDR